jgi:hypothetical protein
VTDENDGNEECDPEVVYALEGNPEILQADTAEGQEHEQRGNQKPCDNLK